MTATEALSLASIYKIEFQEISVAENPEELDMLLNSSIIQQRREDEAEQGNSKKQVVRTMSRVLSSILSGGRGSLPPELGGSEKGEKVSFKTVFKKRSV